MRKLIVGFTIWTLVGSAAFGQASFRVGMLPGVNINKKISGDWRLNLRMEGRLDLWKGTFSSPSDPDVRYDLTDMALVTSRKVGANNSLGAGYLIRFRGDEINHRFIQQFTIVTKYDAFRLAHRISTDQTFEPGEPWEFRLRYRAAADFGLNGREVDPGEFYLKFNNEYLGSIEGKEWDLEVRLVPVLGYAVNDDNKIEFGLDYRMDSFLAGPSHSTFWVALNWFVSF